MDSRTGLLLLGGAAAVAYFATRSKEPAAPAASTPGPQGPVVQPKPVAGYSQALIDPATNQWTWFPSPQPYVVNEQGYPVPAQIGQIPAGWGIPVVNPAGQIPGAPDLQTASNAASTATSGDWYAYDSTLGAYVTTGTGYLAIASALADMRAQPLASSAANGSQAYMFQRQPEGSTYPMLQGQASAAGALLFMPKSILDQLKSGVSTVVPANVVPAANVPGFIKSLRDNAGDDAVWIHLPTSTT